MDITASDEKKEKWSGEAIIIVPNATHNGLYRTREDARLYEAV